MIDINIKVRENRCRRTAERRGMRLVKSAQRDHKAIGFGCYHLVSRFERLKPAAHSRGRVNVRCEVEALPGLVTLDAVEAFLGIVEQSVPEISAEV